MSDETRPEEEIQPRYMNHHNACAYVLTGGRKRCDCRFEGLETEQVGGD